MIALEPKELVVQQPAVSHRHFLEVADHHPLELQALVRLARRLKGAPIAAHAGALAGRSIALLFEKPSLRTRVSFEVAMTQLGGHALFAQAGDFLVGTRETPEDAARVLSRYVDAVVIRTHQHEPLCRFARAATVPVINGLSQGHHPCQALADVLTMQEHLGDLAGKTVAYIGDASNNVATSLAQAAMAFGMRVHFGCPHEFRPRAAVVKAAQQLGRARKPFLRVFAHPVRAARNADVVYTDTWVSMGEECADERRRAALEPYRLNAPVLAAAKPHAIVMHCLPAHRGHEIDAAVIDGPQSAVFDQAENRLHAQKALLLSLLGPGGSAEAAI